MEINTLLYDETLSHNPTKLLLELYEYNLPIKEVYKKYKYILSPQEICCILTQQV